MRNNLQLTKMACVWLAWLWCASAQAAEATFVKDIGDIPPAAIALAVLLAILGGATFTAQKMADPAIVVKKVVLEILKDILASIVAGLLTFFLTSWLAWPAKLQCACIMIAGYGGSRVLERYLLAGMARIDRLAGKPEGTP